MWWFEQTVDTFHGFNISDLSIDEAWLNISSDLSQPLWPYIVSSNCKKCSLQRLAKEPVDLNHSLRIKVSSQYSSTIRFRTVGNSSYTPSASDSFTFCEFPHKFDEFGVYSIRASETTPKCFLETDLAPVDIYLPIVFVFAFWLLCCFIWLKGSKPWIRTYQCIARRLRNPFNQPQINPQEETNLINDATSTNKASIQSSDENATGSRETQNEDRLLSIRRSTRSETRKATTSTNQRVTPAKREHPSSSKPKPVPSQEESCSSATDSAAQRNQPKQKERLTSLDAFRGLCICIMIFADDGGAGYYFFQHCTWDGLYFADLAFPWFLWICGVCIPFSLQSRIQNGSSKLSLSTEILKRSLKLLLLGIMVNTSTRSIPVQLENLRFPGVLQRFGICYFIASILYLLFCCKSIHSRSRLGGMETNSWWNLKDVRIAALPWLFVLSCAGAHTLILFLLPVPHCPTGYLGPGGLHNDNMTKSDCVGGAAGYIDRAIFGVNHIHIRPTSQKVYGSGPFDPEGSLGLLQSILQIWLGVQAGIILLIHKGPKERVIRFISWGVICGVFGFVVCGGLENQGWIPINKNLWSLSFVLVTTSAAYLLLLVMYYVIDMTKLWSGSPFAEVGMNSIFLYLAHEICHAVFPWHYKFGSMRTHISRLIESSWGTVLWVIVGIHLYNKKLFFIV